MMTLASSPLYKYPASHYKDQLKEQRHLDQQVVHNNDKVLGEIFRERYRSEQNFYIPWYY